MNAMNVAARSADPGLVTTVGVFPGYAEAGRAVTALRQAGFRDDQIGVIGPADRMDESPDTPPAPRWQEGAGIGAAAGGLAGLGLGAAVAAGLLSPLGPVVAGGAFVALLASAGGGAAAGTLVGALAQMGMPEDDANWYTTEAQAGRVVVTVRGANAARDILDRHGATRRPGAETAIPGNAVPATPY